MRAQSLTRKGGEQKVREWAQTPSLTRNTGHRQVSGRDR
jgi:hypothetical protein